MAKRFQEPQATPLSLTAISSVSDILWEFVELKDVLNVSVCSRNTAGLPVPAPVLNTLVSRKEKTATIGHNLNLTFQHELTTGLVRRVMNRLNTPKSEVVLSIDDRTGRIMLDIGSAFHDKDAFLACAEFAAPPSVTSLNNTPVEDTEHAQIFKHIEISSYDEYDDFNPRHPVPKDRAHRRGDSLFNSDIDTVVNELGNVSLNPNSAAPSGITAGFDLSTIAAKVAQEEASSREHHHGANSVKNRILARARGGAATTAGTGAHKVVVAGLPPKPPGAPNHFD